MATAAQQNAAQSQRNSYPTIGFIIDDISLGYQQTLWQGVVAAAENLQVNLVTFIGGGFQGNEPFAAQENAIYELIAAETVAGLIIASGTLFSDTAEQARQTIQATFPSLPTVSIALGLENIPSLLIDNHSGMYQAVSHLIDDHGYRNIAFIQQYAGNSEAEERYQAYLAALNDHEIEFDPNLVVPPDFDTDPTGAVTTLLTDRQAKVDAIVCVDDTMAIGIMAALPSFDLHVPQDIAVVGFDNIEDGNFSAPPLTTVHQPIHRQGQMAVELLLKQINGIEVEPIVRLATALVTRESCGCLPIQPQTTEGAPPEIRLDVTALAPQKEKLSAMLNEKAEIPTNETWATADLIAAFAAVIKTQDETKFIRSVNRIFTQLQTQTDQLQHWQNMLRFLRQFLLPPDFKELTLSAQIETWLFQSQTLLSDIALRGQKQRQNSTEQFTTNIREWGQALNTAADFPTFYEIMANGLQFLGVPGFGLILQPDNEIAANQYQIPILFTSTGVLTDTLLPKSQIIPDQLLPETQSVSLVIRPIYHQTTSHGYVIFEYSPQISSQYLNLAEYISSSLHGLKLSVTTSAALNRANILNITSRRLRDVTSVAEAVQAAVEGTADGTQADIVVINIIDTATETVELVSMAGPHAPEEFDRASYGELWEGLSGLALRDLEPIFSPKTMIPDPRESPEAQKRREDFGAGSIIIAPLHSQRETFGTMTLIKRLESPDFTNMDLGLATSVANQISAALMNTRLFDEMQASLALNERRSAQLSAAAEVAGAISSILDVDVLLPRVVDVIRDRFNLYYVGLFLVDESQQWADLQAGTGEAGQQMLAQNWKLEVGGGSMIGRCIESGQADVQLEVEQAPIHLRNPHLPDTRSEMALPLTSRGSTFGALTIQSTAAHAFTPEDAASLTTMANQIASAIQNTRLFEQTQTALVELERTQRRYLTQAWSEFTQNQTKTGYQSTDADIIPLGNELLPEVQVAMQEKRSIVLADENGTNTILAVPVLLRDEPIGALGFNLPPDKDSWSPDDIAIAEAVSEQFGLAAETLRLLDTTQRRAARERLVTEITTKIRATTDPQAMLHTAASELREALQAQRAQVVVQSKESNS